jgi:putative tryptophan/tyrosine transport system substrate-binding protein
VIRTALAVWRDRGGRPPRAFRPRSAGALLGIMLLLLAGGLVDASAADRRAKPLLIGALTEAWGPTPALIGLRDGLVELGYRENADFVLGIRFTQGSAEELPRAARQLVERGADILVTGGGGTNEARALQQATSRVPVVFMSGSDPVGAGLVKSFARPGGNVTGVADLDVELAPKRLEIFRELVPGLKRVLFAYDAGDPFAVTQLDRYREAARRLGLALIERPVRTQPEAQRVFANVPKSEADGLLSPRFLSLNIPGFIIEAGLRQSVPTMLHASYFVEQGGLASYAANLYELGRHAARLVDRIIKGARPADIPVEQATRFELVINLKTARALGLAIPQSLLQRADRVIE